MSREGSSSLHIRSLPEISSGPQFLHRLNLALIGYFVAWAASILALAASFWKARVDKASVAVTVNVPPPPPPTEVNVNPTISVTQTQISGEGKSARPVDTTQAKQVELPHLEGDTTPEEVVSTLNSLKYLQSSGAITSEQLHQD